MISKYKLKAYNDLEDTHEYSTKCIQQILETSGIIDEEISILSDLIQNTSMLIQGVTSAEYDKNTIDKLMTTCNEEVQEIFQEAIRKKDITIVTNYPKKGSKSKTQSNLWNYFMSKFYNR